MKRRTLDIVFSIGGGAITLLLLVLGLILQGQANFADDYVTDQLSAQNITFTPLENLTDEEKEAECLVDNAGEALTTGKQAECYANEYIGLHLTEVNEGMTYAETSSASWAAKAKADEAIESAPDSPESQALAATAEQLNGQVQTLFRGETLRGLLLTSYGFSIFGERAQQASWVCFGVSLVLLLATIAGFVHAFTTPKDEVVDL